MAKKYTDKQYIVLGLGVFGSTVAKTLSKYNCEVIAVDQDIECVQRVAEEVTQAVRGDITSIDLLQAAGAADCDVAIVAVGSHLEDAIMAILNLKELGVPYIVAKAKNKRYLEILRKVGADKVFRPEKEMGVMAAKGLLNLSIIDMVDLDDKHSVVEIQVPDKWIGRNLAELDLRHKYQINVLGIRYSDNQLDVAPDAEYHLDAADHLLIISDVDTIQRLEELK